MSELLEILSKLQKDLNVPKDRFHGHKKYEYRNLEDILDVAKPLLPPGVVIGCTDEIVQIGDRYYVKATATIEFKNESRSASAFAREPDGDPSRNQVQQVTMTCSSYARRYALNGLLAISGHKDDNTEELDTGGQQYAPQPQYQEPPRPNPFLNEFTQAFLDNNAQLGLKICEKIPADQKDAFWKVLTKDQRDWVRDARAALASV